MYLHGAGVWNDPPSFVRSFSVYLYEPSIPFRVKPLSIEYAAGPGVKDGLITIVR